MLYGGTIASGRSCKGEDLDIVSTFEALQVTPRAGIHNVHPLAHQAYGKFIAGSISEEAWKGLGNLCELWAGVVYRTIIVVGRTKAMRVNDTHNIIYIYIYSLRIWDTILTIQQVKADVRIETSSIIQHHPTILLTSTVPNQLSR